MSPIGMLTVGMSPIGMLPSGTFIYNVWWAGWTISKGAWGELTRVLHDYMNGLLQTSVRTNDVDVVHPK